ncbi:MAG: ATP-binding protein, partial [Actinomycetota bacterium]|nr:ATP-binding protein [Actinomycetota bacterium]
TCLLDLLHAEVAAIPGVVVVDGDRAGAMVDRDLMSRAVRNLLSNAQRHTRQAVKVTVTPEGRRAWLHVDDDGPGIDPADRDQVFQRFRRLDEARSADGGGAGLGLSIVASIVRAHGGGVAIGTSPMGGARFSLWVPLLGDSVPSAR